MQGEKGFSKKDSIFFTESDSTDQFQSRMQQTHLQKTAFFPPQKKCKEKKDSHPPFKSRSSRTQQTHLQKRRFFFPKKSKEKYSQSQNFLG